MITKAIQTDLVSEELLSPDKVLGRAAPMNQGTAIFSYSAYGLNIRSDLPLPELTAGEGAADVTVRFGSVNYSPSAATEEFSAMNSEEAYLFWEDAGKFLVRRGREIVVEPAPGTVDQVLRLFILGPALALLLHQRGRLVLHASSVVVAGGVVAFLGGSGWGKSTMAAALHSRGHSLVADDVTAVQVEVDNGSPTVVPGFPQMKLWPETIAYLGSIPETLPRIEPDWDKRAHRVVRGFSPSPVPLHRIYVLAEGETDKVEPLRPQEAFVELVRHTYAAALLDTMGTSQHFLQCASIVNNVPIARLCRRRSLSTLPDVAGLVEEDASQSAERVRISCSENSSPIPSTYWNTRALTGRESHGTETV